MNMLAVEDSWQEARITYLCRGVSVFPGHTHGKTNPYEHASSSSIQSSENFPCLFDVLLKMKASYPKRLYQFIKLLIQLLSK